MTSRPVAVSMVFLASVVFGYFSYARLPVTLMPDLDYPTLTVRTTYSGASPRDVEKEISKPIEAELGVVTGLAKISSVSRAGLSDVVLEFGWDVDVSDATQEVLEKLDVVWLPRDAQRPLILHYDPSLEPVLELSLSGQGDKYVGEAGQRRLRRLAEQQVRREIEPIKGVAAVRIRGGLEEEIHVLVEEEQLRRTGVSMQAIVDRLRDENVSLAGGTVEEGRTEYMVRTIGEFDDIDQIGTSVISVVDGREVRLEDLATIVRSHADREILTRTDSGESVQIEIYKEAEANVVSLAKLVRDRLGTIAETSDGAARGGGLIREGGLAPRLFRDEGAELRLVADRSLFIEGSIDEVRSTVLLGGILAILVLFLFLKDVRTTLIIAVSIPISLIVTFAPMNLFGVTLNIMSLGGLAMGIGMLVDASIVVLESIHRCREEGDGIVDAAIRGTYEVRGAVNASILTTIAVHFPMVFVQGIAGQAFEDLGLTVVVSLVISLAVALFLIPMLASRQAKPIEYDADAEAATAETRSAWSRAVDDAGSSLAGKILFLPRLVSTVPLELAGHLSLALLSGLSAAARFLIGRIGSVVLRAVTWLPLAATDATMAVLHKLYPRILRGSLRHPGLVVGLVAGCLYVSWLLFAALDSELLPEVRQGEFTVEVALPVGTPLAETDDVIAPIERAILEERGEIESLIVTVGRDPSRSQSSDEGENTARFKVLLSDEVSRGREDEVVARLRERFSGIPDLEARISRPVLFSFKTPIEVEVYGDELSVLRRYGQRVAQTMASMPELADVELSLKPGAPEVQLLPDRDRMTALGLRVQQVSQLVRDKVQGTEATTYNLTDRRIPIIVRLAEDDRDTLEEIRNLTVNPGGERQIPLSSVSDVSLGEGPSEIRRIDGRRVALVSANIGDGSLGSATALMRERLSSEIDWPADMGFVVTGQQEEWERSRGSLWLAFGLSVFLVYVIMAAQFESLLQPLMIMFSIPLAFIGTFALMMWLGESISVVVLLGMIMLAGIVVNNAIVLVDYANTLRRRGVPLDEAIVEAGQIRLRPILMTTATTVLGLLPMALGLGQGAELRTPMAHAVIGGLVSSTLLTLIVIPTFYGISERLVTRIGRTLSRAETDTGAALDSAGSPQTR